IRTFSKESSGSGSDASDCSDTECESSESDELNDGLRIENRQSSIPSIIRHAVNVHDTEPELSDVQVNDCFDDSDVGNIGYGERPGRNVGDIGYDERPDRNLPRVMVPWHDAEGMLAERSTDHNSEIESNSSCDQSISGDDDATGQISTDNSNEDGRSDGENGYDNCLPLFKDSSLSVPEFNAILLALKQRHNFSNLALDSILKMFQICLPEESNLPYTSSYLFEQKIEKQLMYTSTKYLTCMSCQTLLTSDLLCENQICTHYRECEKGEDSSVFYTVDILPELKRLIPESWESIKKFTENFDHTPGVYKDIIDGSIYQKQYREVWKTGSFPITIYWHLGGAPAFRSNSISIKQHLSLANSEFYR
ncbi:Hypothetical predicted protein, partial [Paramuricea clavata]